MLRMVTIEIVINITYVHVCMGITISCRFALSHFGTMLLVFSDDWMPFLPAGQQCRSTDSIWMPRKLPNLFRVWLFLTPDRGKWHFNWVTIVTCIYAAGSKFGLTVWLHSIRYLHRPSIILPHSHSTNWVPRRGIAEKMFVITVAPQNLFCPHGRAYPMKAA